jgi:hypothetical protein
MAGFYISSVEVSGSMTTELALLVSLLQYSQQTNYEQNQTVPVGITTDISKLNCLLMMRINTALLSNMNFIT